LEQLGHSALLQAYGDRDNRAINELVDMEMPNLESLDSAEIVSIRSGNEFEQWRRTLKAALADAALQPADLYNRPAEVRRVIDEKLVQGKDQLETAISKSAALAGLKKGAVSLLAGLTSAVVVHYLTNNNFLATMAGTSASATVGGAAEAITTPRITDAQRALLAHYVAVLR
jgi:lysozyme family protein